jgi:hypothetical protein
MTLNHSSMEAVCPGGWNCTHCTFLKNSEITLQSCEVCTNPRSDGNQDSGASAGEGPKLEAGATAVKLEMQGVVVGVRRCCLVMGFCSVVLFMLAAAPALHQQDASG